MTAGILSASASGASAPRFLAYTDNGLLISSQNGVSWSLVAKDYTLSGNAYTIRWLGNRWLIGENIVSPNAANQIQGVTVPGNIRERMAAYDGSNRVVYVGLDLDDPAPRPLASIYGDSPYNSFTPVNTSIPTPANTSGGSCVDYFNGNFVTIAGDAAIAYSSNGESWTNALSISDWFGGGGWGDTAKSGSYVVLTSSAGFTSSDYWYSANGTTFSTITANDLASPDVVTYDSTNSQFILANAASAQIKSDITSASGTIASLPSFSDVRQAASIDGITCIGGANSGSPRIAYSANGGASWAVASLPTLSGAARIIAVGARV